MPNVLAKLGADVLAVNPYASTGGVIGFDRDAAAERVAALVAASGAHLGAVFDPDGERLMLIDDEGVVLTDHRGAAALRRPRVRPPARRPHRPACDRHAARAHAGAERHGVHVRDTKLSGAALMDAATEPGVGFAADGEGGFILPGFLPAFDAAAAFVKMLDLLARSGRQLSDVRDALPACHIAHETVVTPWEQKGLVMRSLVEHANRELVLVDGVKVAARRLRGPRAARSGGADHACVGRGRVRQRRPPAGAGVRSPHPPAGAVAGRTGRSRTSEVRCRVG